MCSRSVDVENTNIEIHVEKPNPFDKERSTVEAIIRSTIVFATEFVADHACC